MANNDWSDFMSSRIVRMICNVIVIVACARYGGEAARQLLSPDTAGVLYQNVGQAGYYGIYGAQLAVCIFVVVQFARRLVKDITNK